MCVWHMHLCWNLEGKNLRSMHAMHRPGGGGRGRCFCPDMMMCLLRTHMRLAGTAAGWAVRLSATQRAGLEGHGSRRASTASQPPIVRLWGRWRRARHARPLGGTAHDDDDDVELPLGSSLCKMGHLRRWLAREVPLKCTIVQAIVSKGSIIARHRPCTVPPDLHVWWCMARPILYAPLLRSQMSNVHAWGRHRTRCPMLRMREEGLSQRRRGQQP